MQRSVLLATVLLLSMAPMAAAQSTTRLCYDDAGDGDCETNLIVRDANIASIGTFLVCDQHVLLNAPDSASCPAAAPGVYFACAPAEGGYCNATVVAWGINLYSLDVTATEGEATITMGGFPGATYVARLDGAEVATMSGSTLQSVTVPAGTARRVVFELDSAATPGAQDGSPPPLVAAPAPPPAVVTAAPGTRTPSGSPHEPGALAVKLGALALGVGMVVMGEARHFSAVNPAWGKRQPKHWLAVAGGIMALVALLSLIPA